MELQGIAFNSSLQMENSDYYRVLTPALERLVSSSELGRRRLGKDCGGSPGPSSTVLIQENLDAKGRRKTGIS